MGHQTLHHDWIDKSRIKKSICRHLMSSVPQGSLLGPLVFIIYINNFNVNVDSMISKFVDDTEVSAIMESE